MVRLIYEGHSESNAARFLFMTLSFKDIQIVHHKKVYRGRRGKTVMRNKTDICSISLNFKLFINIFIFFYFPILVKVIKLKLEALYLFPVFYR